MEWVNFGIGENEATTTPGLVQALTQMLTQPTGILGLTIYISVVSLVSSACGHQKEGIGIPTLIFSHSMRYLSYSSQQVESTAFEDILWNSWLWSNRLPTF